MARRKTITRDQILNAAYEVVAQEGFSKLTARNIANHMKCSTQPIYLEFKNMEDLRQALFKKIQDYLTEVILAESHTGDVLIDMTLNYIHFACKEKTLYKALYMETYENNHLMSDFIIDTFMHEFNKDEKLSSLPDDKKKALMTGTWIVASGIAALQTGGLIQPTDNEIIVMLENVISSIIVNDGSPHFL